MTKETLKESAMTLLLVKSTRFPQASHVTIYDDGFKVYKLGQDLYIGYYGDDCTIECDTIDAVIDIYHQEKYSNETGSV